MNLLIALSLLAAPPVVTQDDAAFHIAVESDWQVEAADAQREADQRLHSVVWNLITTLDPTLRDESDAICGLLREPGVKHLDEHETRDRPFGTLHRETRRVELPRVALLTWRETLHQQAATRSLRHWLLLATTAAMWLVFAVTARWYDRRTRGYRRPLIVMSAVLLLVASAAIHFHVRSPSKGLGGGATGDRIRGGATPDRSPVIHHGVKHGSRRVTFLVAEPRVTRRHVTSNVAPPRGIPGIAWVVNPRDEEAV